MSKQETKLTRRSTIKTMSAIGTAAVLGNVTATGQLAQAQTANFKADLRAEIHKTPFIDTHEHLLEEEERLSGNSHRIKANDWSFLLSHYLDSDLLTAGMPQQDHNAFFSAEISPKKKWDILEPYWWKVKNTGYGQATEIAMRQLYNVPELSANTIGKIQAEYQRSIKPGLYKSVLQDTANIESCQVNCLSAPFSESSQPTLLMQDISIVFLQTGPKLDNYTPRAVTSITALSDWHAEIDWWFAHYGPYAVAVKSQRAYGRNIDFDTIPAERAEAPFNKRVKGESLSSTEAKLLEDHLFWYCVEKANQYHLPVKLHTGYYAGQNYMPLSRVQENPGAITDLCTKSPETRFDFFHIGYPCYEELIAAAKHYTNAHIDMCWAWIINPVASKDFLKKFIVTAPANKVFTFGGDYIPVEPVVGHAAIARNGITQALYELVEEGWLTKDNAMALVEPLLRGNARQFFDLDQKYKMAASAPWL
jgi:predicted TIM-barrel fold metal-dependent hydrolase